MLKRIAGRVGDTGSPALAGWLAGAVCMGLLIAAYVPDAWAGRATSPTGATAVLPSEDDLLFLEIRLGDVILAGTAPLASCCSRPP